MSHNFPCRQANNPKDSPMLSLFCVKFVYVCIVPIAYPQSELNMYLHMYVPLHYDYPYHIMLNQCLIPLSCSDSPGK